MKTIKLDTSKLFKDGKKFYAIYTGTVDGEILLSGAKQIFQVKPGETDVLPKKLKEGDRIYFDDKGIMSGTKAANPPEETGNRKSGTTRFAKGREHVPG